KLYHQTLAIRPKLIKLIEKYSQKKDDFTQLNEKFIKARRDYEALLESSMSHPPHHSYQQYAMRPAPPGQQGYVGGGYIQGQPPPHDAYHNQQVPVSDHHHYQPSSPPPNSTNTNYPPQGTSAPFYVAGSEVPSHGSAHGPTSQQQYPPREDTPNMGPSAHPSSPPPAHSFGPYSQLPQQHQHPPSTYGAQELATSVYDSPIAPQNPPSGGPYGQQYPKPPPPSTGTASRPPQSSSMSPSPLQPAGQHPHPHPHQHQQQPPSQPQYKPYVPPGTTDGSSPNDFYRQGGQY
ncbi:hypothetical protein E4U55_001065, partial [Claviceps digitariae]